MPLVSLDGALSVMSKIESESIGCGVLSGHTPRTCSAFSKIIPGTVPVNFVILFRVMGVNDVNHRRINLLVNPSNRPVGGRLLFPGRQFHLVIEFFLIL